MSSPARILEGLGTQLKFSVFLEKYAETLRNVFSVRADINKLSLNRGLPAFVMREINACDPLSVYIPTEYGGRGGLTHECTAMLSASAYEALGLSLTFGINGALFLQPLAKYGNEEIKGGIFDRFLKDGAMGGLMITEPDFGSDALNMKTSYTDQGDHYKLKGTKHWGGLTGEADYWLVTARKKAADGNLGRDIDFFVVDTNQPEQHIHVDEVFPNLGLYMIPYGRNQIDIAVPSDQRLKPKSTGIKMMLDILHSSRVQFPGMGLGFLQRMMDEGIQHAKMRSVGGKSLFSYDQVQRRLARMQAFFTTCSAMCAFTAKTAGLDKDLSKENVSANAIKTVVTDFMQEASQSLVQLMGAKGYRLDHIAGRGTVDSRPFQIFEGSNDILYQQISESVLKSMKRLKETNMYRFLKDYSLTSLAADDLKDVFNFEVDGALSQRKMVDLGRALGRTICAHLTIELGQKGYRSDLIANCLSLLKEEISGLIGTLRRAGTTEVEAEYQEDSSWLAFI